ncbi:MAG: hypothetical protein ACE5HV_17115, partial [Acidobacteriota bacterium]
DEIRQTAISAGVDTCWSQWAVLGAPASTRKRANRSIIDPEALVLLSLGMRSYERRLVDLLGWWARVGSSYLSVQRMIALADSFPEKVRKRVGEFASLAYAAGDRRWRRFAGEINGLPKVREKGRDEPHLTARPALLLRLRAGFGLSIKSDLLAVLLGLCGEQATVRTLLQATRYTEPPFRDAARDMVLAKLIRQTSERPVRYFANPEPWMGVFQIYGISNRSPAFHDEGEATQAPAWRFWGDVFALLCATIFGIERLKEKERVSPYVASSRLRDIYETHRGAFERNRIPTPDPTDFPGELYLEAFRTTISTTADWTRRVL